MYLTMRCEVWRIANAPGVEQPDTSQHQQVTRKDLKERTPQTRQIISMNSLSVEGRLSAWLANFEEFLSNLYGKTVSDPGQSVCDRFANKILRRGGNAARATRLRSPSLVTSFPWPLLAMNVAFCCIHFLGQLDI